MTYPPNSFECQKLFQELLKLDELDRGENNYRKYEIIHDLAEACFFEAKPYFFEGLNHPDADYRWACVSAIATHWQDRKIIPRLFELVENDPDSSVRDIAISSLGMFKVKKALPLLKKIITSNKDDLHLQKIAYAAILRIMDYPPREVLELAIRDDFSSNQMDEKLLYSLPDE